MSRYLNLARTGLPANEKNEKDEESPSMGFALNEAHYEINEIDEKSPRALSRADAMALGLNPALVWVRVSRDEVEASTPPPGWDGTLPVGCAWPRLCRTLGPCPRQQTGATCRISSGERST